MEAIARAARIATDNDVLLWVRLESGRLAALPGPPAMVTFDARLAVVAASNFYFWSGRHRGIEREPAGADNDKSNLAAEDKSSYGSLDFAQRDLRPTTNPSRLYKLENAVRIRSECSGRHPCQSQNVVSRIGDRHVGTGLRRCAARQ